MAAVCASALHDQQGRLIACSETTRDLTARLQKEQGPRASQESLRQHSNPLLRIRDEDRRRSGRELLDALGQYLAMLEMHLSSLNAIFPSTEAIDEDLTKCVQLSEGPRQEVSTGAFQ